MNIHDYRIFGLAIFDLVLTLISVIILHYYIWNNPTHKIEKRTLNQSILLFILLFVTFMGLGLIFHWIFKIDSRLSYYIGI